MVNFLDVQLDLKNNSYKPYRKPNNEPIYIHKESNHPPAILKQIPKIINRRISDLCSNRDIYAKEIPSYETALKKSGFSEKLEYSPKVSDQSHQVQNNKKRKRKIIWFNPPFSANVKTNVGKIFLKLVKKHFPKGHQLAKIFNRNTLKVSYSCMKNVNSIISAHNKTVLNPKNNEEHGCNCRVKENCPLQNKCLTPCLIYEATVSNDQNNEVKRYIGLTEGTFKQRYANHCKDFRQIKYEKSTELSKYVWSIKKDGRTPIIKWKILKKVVSKPRKDYCRLCLMEKMYIINSIGDHMLLNSRSELVSKCRHQNKYIIKYLRN